MAVEFTYLYETDKKDSLPILALVTLDNEDILKLSQVPMVSCLK